MTPSSITQGTTPPEKLPKQAMEAVILVVSHPTPLTLQNLPLAYTPLCASSGIVMRGKKTFKI